MTVAINARACGRAEIGGVERYAMEISRRLIELAPERYRMIAPPPRLAHRAGHAWEQFLLPVRTRADAVLYCPANLAPVMAPDNVVVIHDTAALSVPEAYSRTYIAYQRLMLPAIARRARALITVSEFSKAELVTQLGADPGAITVIPPGVDLRFTPRARRAGSDAPPYVLVLGTESARKNHGALTSVATALATAGIELVIAGSDRGYLRSAGGDAGHIRRLGYVPEHELAALYAGARALVMPSLYEGFGLPCIEAMASGVPVVASRAAALPETCGDAALLVDPQDPGAFASATLAAVGDAALRARLIPAGLERARAFTWDRAAASTHGLLSGLDR